MVPQLQEWIHTLEEGRGAKVIKVLALLLAFIALAVLYDMRCFKNFATTEAMDAAQVAHNLADGKGFSTSCIRPFSLYLVRDHREDHDPLIKTNHPDLANPPVYPALLAGLMKAAPVKYEITRKQPFITYEPERWIAGLNQFLFFCSILMVYGLGRKLFEAAVGWISVLVYIGADIFWRFSVSGLSTNLLIVLFLGLVWCLVTLDQWQRDENVEVARVAVMGALAGLLLGLAGMTRYSFLWLIVPVIVYLMVFVQRCRGTAIVSVTVVFFIVVSPWIVRNFMVSGTPFGINGYAIFEQTLPFPGDTLQRSLHPEFLFDKLTPTDFGRKFAQNLRGVVMNDLPRMGASWISAFFLCGLLLRYRNPTLSRLRIFLLASLALFVVVQALGRTNLTNELNPEMNSENLLVVFAPILFVFGVGFYFTLLDQMELPDPNLHHLVTAALVAVCSFPLISALLPPRGHPYVYPPYFPPLIQQMAGWMKTDELIMSDMPAAVAWYGNRQCCALTLDYDKAFYAINDDMKTVRGLYLTPVTLNQPFLMQMLRPMIKNQKTWERFIFESLSRGEVVSGFPLKKSRLDFLPDHLFLTDWERWKVRGVNQPAPQPKLPEEEQSPQKTEGGNLKPIVEPSKKDEGITAPPVNGTQAEPKTEEPKAGEPKSP